MRKKFAIIIVFMIVLIIAVLFFSLQFFGRPGQGYFIDPLSGFPKLDVLGRFIQSPNIETNPFYENPFR